jgi:hypothetical protein
MTLIAPNAYARARKVPRRTVYDAVAAGLIDVDAQGRLNVEKTDAGWFADHRTRARQVKATDASRQRQRDAAAVASASAIRGLRRSLEELQRTTVPREAAEGARARRVARLKAALHCLPTLYAPAAAEALDLPLDVTQAILIRFAGRLLNDLALEDIAGS